jgi:dihydrodipicolinate synthase/N-acetylneuraminate lyase
MQANGSAHPAWSWEHALSGIVPPMISPLTEDGLVDVVSVGNVVEHILRGGCSGLFVVGGCGEGAWLAASERGLTIEATVAAAHGRVPVLAGCMLPGTAPTLDAVRQAEAAGADAIVAGSAYYFGADGAAQLRHLQAVLEETRLPLLLYNIPQCVGTMVDIDTVRALARSPRVLGIKDSSGDLGYFQQLVAIKQDVPTFRVLQGNEAVASASLLLGGDGLIPGYANLVPELYVELREAAARADVAGCRRLQERINGLTTLGSIPDIKAALELMGLSGGTPALPFAPRTDEQRAQIRGVLDRYGLLTPAAAG